MKASKSSTTSGLSPLCSHFVIKKSSEWTFDDFWSGIDGRTGFHPRTALLRGRRSVFVWFAGSSSREVGAPFGMRFGIRRSLVTVSLRFHGLCPYPIARSFGVAQAQSAIRHCCASDQNPRMLKSRRLFPVTPFLSRSFFAVFLAEFRANNALNCRANLPKSSLFRRFSKPFFALR